MLRKHIPQRTCIYCRQVKPKRELVRIVSTPEGKVEIDTSGKKAGRGAYLCASQECWQAGLKGKKLEHVLRTSVVPENLKKLGDEGRELLEGDK